MIHIHQLWKQHGTATVLEDITLNIAAGETVAFIGPSGSGKSTLLRCINALENFQQGTIRVGEVTRQGNVIPTMPEAVALRRQVGMVFQQFNLFPHMTARENVESGPVYVLGKSRGEARTIAEKLLEQVGLKDRMLHRPGQLSGGQQQRVAIARALAVNPRVMLYDEPTSALDPQSAQEVMAVIERMDVEGMTSLIVTHSMNFARRIADRVYFMSGGKLVEQGTASQLFDAPRTPQAVEFLRKVSS